VVKRSPVSAAPNLDLARGTIWIDSDSSTQQVSRKGSDSIHASYDLGIPIACRGNPICQHTTRPAFMSS
jgi:hypothetical protein